MTDYRVTFERLGRGAPPDPRVFEAVSDPDELAAFVYSLARSRLISRAIDVVLDLDEGKGSVFAGFQHVGQFTIEAVSASDEGT